MSLFFIFCVGGFWCFMFFSDARVVKESKEEGCLPTNVASSSSKDSDFNEDSDRGNVA